MANVWFGPGGTAGDWNDAANWFGDSGKSTGYGQIPQNGDNVYLTGPDIPTTAPLSAVTLLVFDTSGCDVGTTLTTAVTAGGGVLLASNGSIVGGVLGDATSNHVISIAGGGSLAVLTLQGGASCNSGLTVQSMNLYNSAKLDAGANIFQTNSYGGASGFNGTSGMVNGAIYTIDSGSCWSYGTSATFDTGSQITIGTSGTLVSSNSNFVNCTVTNHGTFRVNDAFTVGTNFNLTHYASTGTLTFDIGALNVGGGTFTLQDGNYTIAGSGSLTNASGVIYCASAIMAVSNGFTWSAGTFFNYGAFTYTDLVSISTDMQYVQSGPSASATWTGGVSLVSGGVFSVASGASFQFSSGDTMNGGILEASGTGSSVVFTAGTQATGGTLTCDGGNRIEFQNGQDIMGATLNGDISIADTTLMAAGTTIGGSGARFLA